MFSLKNTVVLTALLSIITLTVPAGAQAPDPSSLTNKADFLTIKILPKNPGPESEVSARVEYGLTDLKKAEISWFVNGELLKRGIGESVLKFQTGPLGSVSRVRVTISPFEGGFVEKELALRPAEVGIVWNADTYTPPFYKGKALYTNKSDLTITAIPHFVSTSGGKINPQSLIYNWYKGTTFLVNESGVGRSSFILPGKTISRDLEIKVTVSTLDESISAEKTATINIENPKILIYQESPLYGMMFNRALENFVMDEREITLSAVPYFFSALFKDASNLLYSWTQNGAKISLPSHESSLILRQTDPSLSGEINIGVRVSNQENQIQNADAKTLIRINR